MQMFFYVQQKTQYESAGIFLLYIYPMKILYSFIVPVYNRPDEIDELLQSMTLQDSNISFEVVIVEDGSTIPCKSVIDQYKEQLHLLYFMKPNTGPGDSRNAGMEKANGDFFLILDSDVILPKDYLFHVHSFLKNHPVDCFGGPDLAHDSFSSLQKAIDFTMTSFLTTGGIRGSKTPIQTYEPRSFNMGIQKKLFYETKGFTNIHPGEDPDLSIRIQKLGYKTVFNPLAGVYHKRRISFEKFFKQVYKFGLVRPILFKKHPSSRKLSYFFPSLFGLAFLLSIILCFFSSYSLLFLFLSYFSVVFVVSLQKFQSISISSQVLLAVIIQFFGYGLGFFNSFFKIHLFHKIPQQEFPFLFYEGKNKF